MVHPLRSPGRIRPGLSPFPGKAGSPPGTAALRAVLPGPLLRRRGGEPHLPPAGRPVLPGRRLSDRRSAAREGRPLWHPSGMDDIAEIERRAREGDARSAYRLGLAYNRRKDFDQAELWLAQAAHLGEREAGLNLGRVLLGRKKAAEAEGWFRWAADAGDPWGMIELARVCRNAGRPDEAEPHLRAAFDAGEPMGAHLLGSLCREQGRPEEAERWYRAAVGEWHTDSLLDLGRLAEESGRPEEAEAFYRWAAGAGVAGAEWRLGNLLLGRPGRQDEGVERLRTAAEGGDMKAALVLAKAGEDRWPEESEAWYRRAAEAKVPGAALELGRFLTARGRFAEAEPWARTAADAGSAKALFLLGGLLAEKLGRPDEGEEAYRGAAEAGFP